MQDLPDYFDGIIEILTTYIEHKTDHFTLQTYGGDYIDGPRGITRARTVSVERSSHLSINFA